MSGCGLGQWAQHYSWDLKTIITLLHFSLWWLILLLMFMQKRMLPVLDGIAICSSVVARQFPRVPSPLLRRNKQMVKTVVKYLELSRDLSFWLKCVLKSMMSTCLLSIPSTIYFCIMCAYLAVYMFIWNLHVGYQMELYCSVTQNVYSLLLHPHSGISTCFTNHEVTNHFNPCICIVNPCHVNKDTCILSDIV